MSRILIAGGGTAGHVVPALALADVLSSRGCQVTFCGTERGMERELVSQAGYSFSTVRIRGFTRKLGWSTVCTLGSIRCRQWTHGAYCAPAAGLCCGGGGLCFGPRGGRGRRSRGPYCGSGDGLAHGVDQSHPQPAGRQSLSFRSLILNARGRNTCTRAGRCGPPCWPQRGRKG